MTHLNGRSPRRALIADDSPLVVELLKKILEDLGVEVVTAETGSEGLELGLEAHSSARPFDVILLDVVMPGLSGNEVAKRLRIAGYERVIITMSATSAPFLEAADAGADYFFNKRVLNRSLIEALLDSSP
jgi:CheY-like chemotaxis protein